MSETKNHQDVSPTEDTNNQKNVGERRPARRTYSPRSERRRS